MESSANAKTASTLPHTPLAGSSLIEVNDAWPWAWAPTIRAMQRVDASGKTKWWKWLMWLEGCQGVIGWRAAGHGLSYACFLRCENPDTSTGISRTCVRYRQQRR